MNPSPMETIRVPHAALPYDQQDISHFKNFDWSKATKRDAVSFSRAAGFKETGMSVNEVALLYDLLEQKRPRLIVELGRNYGCSTRIFLQHLIRHGCILESWDLKQWDGFIPLMNENGYLPGSFVTLGDEQSDFLAVPNISLLVRHSIKSPMSAVVEQNGVDFLLIDTEHSTINALGEYLRWRYYMNGGGMIAFHDSTLPAVSRAIEMVKECEWNEDKGRGGFSREYILDREDGYGIHILEKW